MAAAAAAAHKSFCVCVRFSNSIESERRLIHVHRMHANDERGRGGQQRAPIMEEDTVRVTYVAAAYGVQTRAAC